MIDMTTLGRSTIGFEHLLDLLHGSQQVDATEGFPPYNIEKMADDNYRVTLAVAGFAEEELEVTAQPNQLTVTGRKRPESYSGNMLHKGIAARPFTRQFNLAEHVYVRGAKLADGLLTIDLEREIPEAMKPRRIEIGTGGTLAFREKQAA
jgi:molecular chaperone IbpA